MDNILRGGDNTAGVTDNTSGVGDNHSGGMENKSGVTDDSINFKSMQHGKDVSPDIFNGSLFSLVVFKQLGKGMIIILYLEALISIFDKLFLLVEVFLNIHFHSNSFKGLFPILSITFENLSFAVSRPPSQSFNL